MNFALLVCRGQTEASGMQHQLGRLGIPAEVVRPPRHTRTESCGWAVRIEARQTGGSARAAARAGDRALPHRIRGGERMNYLDNAATTLVKPRAVGEAVHRALTGAAGYARGGYAAAQRAGDLVYDCREQAAALFGLVRPVARRIYTERHARAQHRHPCARKTGDEGRSERLRAQRGHAAARAARHRPGRAAHAALATGAHGAGGQKGARGRDGAVHPESRFQRVRRGLSARRDRAAAERGRRAAHSGRLAVGRRSRARCLALSLPRGGMHARSQGAVRPDGDGTAARPR